MAQLIISFVLNICSCGRMDKAPPSNGEDCGFESHLHCLFSNLVWRCEMENQLARRAVAFAESCLIYCAHKRNATKHRAVVLAKLWALWRNYAKQSLACSSAVACAFFCPPPPSCSPSLPRFQECHPPLCDAPCLILLMSLPKETCKCISRESNPGHIDGNDVFYH